MRDLCRETHTTTHHFTFHSRAHETYVHLDHFLGTLDLQQIITDIEIEAHSLSDHTEVVADFEIPSKKQTYHPWRLQETLLQRPEVVKQSDQATTNYLATNDIPDIPIKILWNAWKAVIRGEFLAISATNNTLCRVKGEHLNKRVREPDCIHVCTYRCTQSAATAQGDKEAACTVGSR
ncbi:hypothetical protein NDU88_001354 [Pleurodeles waltl]|uniref:Endonuclease/exonuclease/phosphatase domain-containing protein n=1 Tax=Pleurodeles waltl TaxID=8319 RepID=A0AAV7MNH1_PLEWA|nr:hypothetical protein NDU88_001354 [Pleurodeles waltl]